MSNDTPVVADGPAATGSRARTLALMVAALGVVFGDIGTSPLYALRECFVGSHKLDLTSANVLGTVSLLFWLLVLVVCVKYILLVLRADNRGEGGIIALQALVVRLGPQRLRNGVLLATVGAVGAALLFSDGVITPAISVLSAVEGVMVTAPGLKWMIIPLTLLVLTALFLIQSKGSTRIGLLFGPVMLVWFTVCAVLGVRAIIQYPAILAALNPIHAVHLMTINGWAGFALMGTVFLALTGAEVLYADIGHFGKQPIRHTWFALVFPALFLNYMGQGAYLLQHIAFGRAAAAPENLYYLLAPAWFVPLLVALATAATVIASQAVISGTFSLARQAVQLGFWPRLRIVHTSASTIGQVYVPFISFALYVFTVGAILVFKDSTHMAAAYGITVSADMLITSCLMMLIAPAFWPAIPRPVLYFFGACFLLLDMSLFSANLAKLMSGGWIVVVLAAIIVLLMSTWVSGRAFLRKTVESQSFPLEDFVQDVAQVQPVRVPGTAVFLTSSSLAVPRALLHNYRHNKVLHARTLIVAVLMEETPTVLEKERDEVELLGHGITRVILRFGFMETPAVPEMLARIDLPDGPFDPSRASYFLGKESLVLSRRSPRVYWRRRLFTLLARNAQSAAAFFGLPPNRVVELGVQVEL
ncbi:MAG: potassium transporter Kup [Kiritimatiellia bacterium]